MADTAVICVGNPARSDDAVGPAVADELARHGLEVPVFVSDGEPGSLLELWSDCRRVVVVDAVLTGRHRPGTVHVFDATSGPIETRSPTSSHGFGLAQAIELARSLDRLPSHLIVIGIEAGSLAPGDELTAAVRAAVPEAVKQVLSGVADA